MRFSKPPKGFKVGVAVFARLVPLLVAAVVFSGCCAVHTVLPLVKCDPQSSIEFLIDADSDANGGRTTHVRFLLLKKGSAFKTCPTRAVFRQDRERTNDANLGVITKSEEFIKPGTQYTVRMPLGNIEKYKESGKVYIGVIANFADTTAIASNRILTEITRGKTQVVIRISGYNLIGGSPK